MLRQPRRREDQALLRQLLRYRVVLQALTADGRAQPLPPKLEFFTVTSAAVTELLSQGEAGERSSFWLPEIVLRAVMGEVTQAGIKELIQPGGFILLKLDALAATALATLFVESGWLLNLEPAAVHYYGNHRDLDQPPEVRGGWAVCCESGDVRQLR